MIEEVLSILKPSDGKIYIDGTLGAGGHSKRILESARCKVIGIDNNLRKYFFGQDGSTLWVKKNLQKRNKFYFSQNQ